MSHLELLESELQKFEIELSEEQAVLLAAYCDEMERWNKKINVTGLAGRALIRRLIAEPVWIARQLPFKGVLVDIGSGNGSPAIPFHVVSRFEACHLVEPRVKRASFLRHLATRLKLANTAVHRARFEEITPSLNTPDWVSLQGIALSREIVDSIRLMAGPTTTIVWITSSKAGAELNPSGRLIVPITGTEVLLFHLDQS